MLNAFVEGISATNLGALQVFKKMVFETVMKSVYQSIIIKNEVKDNTLTPTYIFTAVIVALLDSIFTVNKALAQTNPVAAQILRARVKERIHEWSE